jgi:lysozyme
MNRDQLQEDLILDEGIRLKPYRCTAGKLTIGVGRNLDDVGISRAETLALLAADIARAEQGLDSYAPWWRSLPEPAARALINMAFNLGSGGLAGFRGMLAALRAGDYNLAAAEALDSKWRQQVGDRATRIAALFRSAEGEIK